jgi:glycosyltransferase involved in cell wall biosynthesis
MKSTLVILTFNEIEGITALYDKIPFSAFDEYFAIDGGSSDGTTEFLRKKGMEVVPQKSRGRGEAFRIAARRATGDCLIFFSSDGNENPDDTVRILEGLKEGYDMVIASRFMKGSRNEESNELFPLRAWANRVFTFTANLLWGGRITDTINGFRGIRKDKFNGMNTDAKGFTIEYQMSIRAMKMKLRVKEMPTIEGDRIGGKSTAGSLSTGWKVLKMIFHELKIGRKFTSGYLSER